MKKFLLLIIATFSISLVFAQITSTTSGGNGNLKNIGAQEGVNADGDFLNTTMIGRWDNGSGSSLAVTIGGIYAYVADGGQGLRIIDISTPSAPVEVGYYLTERVVYEVAVAGNYAYLAAESNGLRIIDISTPSSPVEVGYFDTGGIAQGVALSGNYAYVANGSPGLRIIDVSTPSSPVEVGSIDTDYANKVVINGNYAYVADYSSGMRIIDISTPSSPVEVGYYVTGGLAWGIAIRDNYAYLAEDGLGLRIFDISVPSTPVEVGYYDDFGATGWSVAVSGNYAYLADGTRGLRIIDISTPSVPVEVGYYDTEDEARGVAVNGNYAYVANYSKGLYIISNDLLTESTVSTLNGKVTNAVDGTPIVGALVEIGTLNTTTDAEGNYEITDISEAVLNAVFSGTPLSGTAPLEVSFTDQSSDASHSLVVSATGFSTYTNNQVVINSGETLSMDVSLSPTLSTGEMRIVLNWGSSPSDIDSYLKTPSINGSEYTLSYSYYGYSETAPFATLDIDDTDGFGPETITIYQKFPGTYKYYVHNYDESPDIVTSNAVVQVYTDAGLISTVNIPTSGTGLYWNVLTIDGTTGNVTVINEINDVAPVIAPPPMQSKNVNFKQLEILKNGMEAITSWSWDFGDGSSSSDQNPTHNYTAAGDYTVALTVSTGTANDTETKTDYISVTGTSGGGDIISTTVGGLWHETSTWIGGVVPTASDNVIIDGTVKYNSIWGTGVSSLECMNITINSGDSLFCDSFGPYGVTLQIGGDIINNGTISQDGTYNQSIITVMGTITNYGEFSNGTIWMQSDAAQSITSTNQMEVYKIEMKNGQNLIAGSDLTFIDTYFQFNNGEFIIGDGTTVSFYSTEGGSGNGAGHVDKAHIKGGGTIFSGGFNSTANVYWFNDSTTVENITLTGNIRGKGDFAILGNVVNEDTLQQAEHNYPVNINVFEDFTNKGVIRDNPTDNDNLTLVVHKNFTNEGTINNEVLVLANETAQTLFATQPIEVSRIEIQNGQDIIAGSNIEFLNVGWVNLNGYYETDDFANVVIDNEKTVAFKLNKLADTHIMKMHFKGGGTLYAETYGSAKVQFRDSTSVENVTLTGTISGTGNFRLLSNVTNKDTLQGCGNQYGDAIIVEEDFVNDGVIRNNPYSNYLETIIRKTVTNKGSWANNWVIMEGTADQSFTNEGELTSSFEFRANVSSAITYQWFKDGLAIDGETNEYYKYYYDSYNPQNYNPYGVYYCQTDVEDSRIITIVDNTGGSGNEEDILTETFDGSTFPPTGWTQTILNTANTWKQYNVTNSFSDIDATNVYSAMCPWLPEDQDEWLKSPEFSLSDGIFTLEFYAGYSTAYLAYATMKLHISVNGGTDWKQIWEADNDGLVWTWRKITLDLSSYANNANVMLGWQYVGNDGDWVGIDNVNLTQGTTGIFEQGVEKDYIHVQNYPNPFSSQTTISFELDNPKHINLIIYNSLGQKIVEPFNAELNSGKHQFTFDAKGLKSGIYYYRFIVDGVSTTKPMIMTK